MFNILFALGLSIPAAIAAPAPPNVTFSPSAATCSTTVNSSCSAAVTEKNIEPTTSGLTKLPPTLSKTVDVSGIPANPEGLSITSTFASLKAQQSGQFTFVFAPKKTGTHFGRFYPTSRSPGLLTFSSIVPGGDYRMPSTFSFGGIDQETSAFTDIGLMNVGNGSLHISGFAMYYVNPYPGTSGYGQPTYDANGKLIASENFNVVSTTCPPALPAGGTCTVRVRFSPNVDTSYSAALRVTSDAVDQATIVSGFGNP